MNPKSLLASLKDCWDITIARSRMSTSHIINIIIHYEGINCVFLSKGKKSHTGAR